MASEYDENLKRLLSLYANHSTLCGCFICRHLTLEQRESLDEFWRHWGGRKARTKNPYSPQNRRRG